MKLNVYYMTREFCSPSGFFIVAKNKTAAINLSNKTYGWCETTVQRIDMKKESVLPSGNNRTGKNSNFLYPNLMSHSKPQLEEEIDDDEYLDDL